MPYDQAAAKKPVTEQDLVAWSLVADAAAPVMRPGDINWTMIVRSLVAEVRRLGHAPITADVSSESA